jgi:predicted site-specific integrase-resolvase
MKNLPNNSLKKFVKIGEAAAKLGVSIDTLRRWEKTGKI